MIAPARALALTLASPGPRNAAHRSGAGRGGARARLRGLPGGRLPRRRADPAGGRRQGASQRGLGAVSARGERVLRRRAPRGARALRAARARARWPARRDGAVPRRGLPLDGGGARARGGRVRAPRQEGVADAPGTRRSPASGSRRWPPRATPPRRARSFSRSRATSPRTRSPTRRCAGSARRARRARRRRAPPPATPPCPARPGRELPPADRLRRAESLTKDRHWDEALAELAQAPRDVAAGARGRARLPDRDDEVPHAARLRQGGRAAARRRRRTSRATRRPPRSSTARGRCRASTATTRRSPATARCVAQFPRSRYAAEAQYLSGWLDYNRGRFRESLPALQATLDHFGSSAFADDAAWCVAFAHFLLGDAAEAAAGFERYGRLPVDGDRLRRGRGARRLLARPAAREDRPPGRGRGRPTGSSPGAARSRSTACSRARVSSRPGTRSPIQLPGEEGRRRRARPTRERDPAVARASELHRRRHERRGGLGAGARGEGDRSSASAARRSLPYLLDLYQRAGDFHRAYRLVEAHGAGALAADPARRRRGARVLAGRLPHAPTRRSSTSTARRPATPTSTSTRSCARSRGSTRTTSRTRTRAASCR